MQSWQYALAFARDDLPVVIRSEEATISALTKKEIIDHVDDPRDFWDRGKLYPDHPFVAWACEHSRRDLLQTANAAAEELHRYQAMSGAGRAVQLYRPQIDRVRQEGDVEVDCPLCPEAICVGSLGELALHCQSRHSNGDRP